MSNRPCKAAADCNGDIMEAITNIPLLIMTGHITDPEAIDDFNDMKEGWAKEYRQWKKNNIDFGSTDSG